jgi:ubiquinone/menaquinone biosynthesis C-methylase UbiE
MMNDQLREQYYQDVASYYDEDARDFEQRYEENPVLQRIRSSFREITEQVPFESALEIGCGPGIDVEYFASKYPERQIHAIDISPRMVELARKRCTQKDLGNVHFAAGSVEDIPELFPDRKFDLIFVYFGGLNTVYDLSEAARQIRLISAPDARLVLTFVNRFYLTEIPFWLIKGRFGKAFQRITNRWSGYSDLREISSRPYSAGDVRKAFGSEFLISGRRGFSLFYPAWYRSHLLAKLGSIAETLWKLDCVLSRTPFWNIGEYSLYEMRVKKSA